MGPGRERGASLVEFAIIAPLLILLIFGIIETSRAIFSYSSVWTAAREGARTATTTDNYLDCTAIRNAAAGSSTLLPIDPSADVAVVYLDGALGTQIADCQGGTPPTYQDPSGPTVAGGISSGDLVQVTVTGTFDSLVPIVGTFIDGLVLDSSQQRTIYVAEEVGGP